MSRRGSMVPGAGPKPKMPGVEALSKRRPSNFKDGKSEAPVVKEGDVFYRTVRFFPSIPDLPEDVEITVTRPGMEYIREVPSVNSSRKSATDRRGSMMPPSVREDSMEDVTSHAVHGRDRAASIAASVAGADSRKRGVVIWPEWSDADINNEKWDVPKPSRARGVSPTTQHLFDDPDGKLELPPSMRPQSWKRPQDYITDKAILVVDPDHMTSMDLLSANEHVHESELLRWITSQITALWKQCASKNSTSEVSAPTPATDGAPPSDGEFTYMWRPWEHIYAINKVGKGPNIPVYNPAGKYVVRLYWMGAWRKLVIDDTLPFDEEGRMLLPATPRQHELWPMLLSKALMKVASIDYNGGNSSCEFGDFSVIHCLTGWLPETIPLQYGHLDQVWSLLQALLPEFKLPEAPPEPPAEGEEGKPDSAGQDKTKEEKAEKEKDKAEKAEKGSKEGKGKEKDKKDDKKDKKKDDKDKTSFRTVALSARLHRRGGTSDEEKTITSEDLPVPDHPEVMVCAAYSGPPTYPVRISVLREMADASEQLRQSGLSHLYPHPVLLTQTRACPLEPPPPPEKVPAWKMIRPRKKKSTPSSEEALAAEEEKPIKCLELTSPFLKYKVSPVPIPTDTHRPRSALERGSTRVSSRPGTANAEAIEETDENAPEEPEPPQILQVEEQPPPPQEPPVEELQPQEIEVKTTPSGKDKKLKAKSANKKHEKGTEPVKEVPAEGSVTGSTKGDKRGLLPRSPSRRRSSSVSSHKAADVPNKHAPETNKEAKDSKNAEAKAAAASVTANETQTTDCLGEEEQLAEGEEGGEVDGETDAVKPNEIWMDFERFCKCFKTLYIFHKSHTYPANFKHTETKSVVSTGRDKKSAPNTAAGQQPDEKSPYYMFVDNLKPTEIVVSFSALCRWNDPPPLPAAESKAGLKGKDRERGESRAEALTVDTNSLIDGQSTSESKLEVIQPGLLVAEAYSWKSLDIGQPILRLRSTATRAAVLSLPEGRHVLRFSMTAPLGYHVHLCSTIPFVFGDEEKVMAELTKESCRFMDNAIQVMRLLGKCITAFHDSEALPQAMDEFYTTHCPYREHKNLSKHHHNKVFLEALYGLIKKILADANLATPDMAFAWRVLCWDVTSKNILGLPYGASSSRPATGMTSDRGSASRKGSKRQSLSVDPAGEQSDTKLDHWKNREATAEEMINAIKLQKVWRGYYVRKVKDARMPGSELNLQTQQILLKAWAALEPNMEQHGLALFRNMFKVDRDLMPLYPFHKDEWNKISYADYQGSFPDQGPNTWFVVFREVFMVTEEMLCVPKLYVPLPTCMLRVVDNDTGEEMPRVFQKVAPRVYRKNKRGYTFVAEARTIDHAIQAGRWRMRLIGSLSPLPAPARNDVNSSFHCREIRDYYLPNEKNVILRYTMKVTEDHLASLQVSTSKPDVYLRLSVLDHETEIMGTVGKGHAVLPAVFLLKDGGGEDEVKRTSSRASNKGSKLTGTSSKESMGKGKRAGSAASRTSTRHSVTSLDEEEERDTKPHKYVVQAVVLRRSWPLSQSQWSFVQMLKDMEKNELKVAQKERPPSPPKNEKAAAAKGKDKGKGKGKEKDKDKGSRPPSQQFDFTKANWTLRIVSDATAAEEIEVKKDTERADEIRALKKAWEEAEPGRAAKAMQSRLQYLNAHMVKVDQDEEEVSKEETETVAAEMESLHPTEGTGSPQPPTLDALESDSCLTLEPPPPPPPKQILQPLDISPFVRNEDEEPRLRDSDEQARRLQQKQDEIAAYRTFREGVDTWRENDRQQRNAAKLRQLDMCEQMQAALDSARESINEPREAFRQRFLEAERKRLEEIAAQEAALNADKPPTPKGRKSAKGKKSPTGKKKK